VTPLAAGPRVYLDHNATTPVRAEAIRAIEEALRRGWGNPSSVHAEGAAARALVERSRAQVAALLGAEPDEVVFTAGATESNNTAILGLLRRAGRPGGVVASTAEHPSVEGPLAALEAAGWRIDRVAVDAEGLLDPEAVAAALAPDTALVTLLWGNNETGVVQPLERIAPRVRERGIPLHVDATQCVGKLAIDLRRLPVDLLSLSAHKLGGPKGVGALVVRRGAAATPLLLGGPQERRRRGGTENVPGIAGLGAACELAVRELPERLAAWGALRDRLWEGIRAKLPRVRRNGSAVHALCNTLNVEIEGAAGEVLVQALDLEGIAVSTGAACASGSLHPSHVLEAMGRTAAAARSSLRLSVGHGVDERAVERVLAVLPDLVARAREAAA
jgi:cysteine desulfurase